LRIWCSEHVCDCRYTSGFETLGSRPGAIINFNPTLEIRAVFNANPSSCNIPYHRTVLLDLDTIADPNVAADLAVNDYFACDTSELS